jgi:hypothetical protein
MKQFYAILVLTFMLCSSNMSAQICPVPFKMRVDSAYTIVLARLESQHSYLNASGARIHTLYVFDVKSYLKGQSKHKKIGLIADGGVVGLFAEHVCPTEFASFGKDYFLLLQQDNYVFDDKDFRSQNPNIAQCKAMSCVQGVWEKENGKFVDEYENDISEMDLLSKLSSEYDLNAQTPDGFAYHPSHEVATQTVNSRAVTSVTDGAGIAQAAYIAGTTVVNNELIINGSGFGATMGFVKFPNVNDAGATTINVPGGSNGGSTIPNTEIISWTDTQIRLKIPSKAGTGTMEVMTSTNTSAGTIPIVIKWSHIMIYNSTNMPGGLNQRQRIELLNNSNGGYMFTPNTGFAADAPAKAAFDRAIATWRCSTAVNFAVLPTTTSVATVAGTDGVNCVFYDPSITAASGNLGVCHSFFGGAFCPVGVMWYVTELDIRFRNNNVGSVTWNYGPGAPAFGDYDFESVTAHEVGHGHGLDHVIDAAKMMHFAISNGQTKRLPSAAEIEGGQFKVAHSSAAHCQSSPTPMLPILTNCNLSVLPLTWLSMNVQLQHRSVLVQWETADEYNNERFEVLRSNGNGIFESISAIKAIHDRSNNAYHFLDEKPLLGMNYYKIKQIDADGRYTFSIVSNVYFSNNQTITIQPNPIENNQIDFVIDSDSESTKTVKIFDLNGKTIYSEVISVQSGRQKVSLPAEQLIKGMYFMSIVDENNVSLQTYKIVK